MRRLFRLIIFLFLAMPLLSQDALAQDYDDLDSSDAAKQKKKKKSRSRDYDEMEVREIARGFYAKTNIGGWIYLLDFNGWVKPGTSVALALGQDFVDNPRSSVAWELAFFQGIHNGEHYEVQSQNIAIAPLIQGDLRTYSGVALIEVSGYPGRRFGIGVRAGGGVLFSPLLIDEDAWNQDFISASGWYQGNDAGYHTGPKPLALFGPTFEYYTKMSHFSVGFDADAIYAIGFDFGISITGTIKYTF